MAVAARGHSIGGEARVGRAVRRDRIGRTGPQVALVALAAEVPPPVAGEDPFKWATTEPLGL